MKVMTASIVALAMIASAPPTSAAPIAPATAAAPQDGGLFPAACRRQQTAGAGVGAVVGGLIGSGVAGRGNRREGAILGAIVGAIAGAAVGRNLSSCEQAIQQQALEMAWRSDKPTVLQAPDTQRYMAAIPAGPHTVINGDECRPMHSYDTDDPDAAPPPNSQGMYCLRNGQLVRA